MDGWKLRFEKWPQEFWPREIWIGKLLAKCEGPVGSNLLLAPPFIELRCDVMPRLPLELLPLPLICRLAVERSRLAKSPKEDLSVIVAVEDDVEETSLMLPLSRLGEPAWLPPLLLLPSLYFVNGLGFRLPTTVGRCETLVRDLLDGNDAAIEGNS